MAEIEHHAHIRTIDLFRHPHGVLDPLHPGALVRVKQQLRPGILGQVGHLAQDLHRMRIDRGIRRRHAVEQQIRTALPSFDQRQHFLERGIVGLSCPAPTSTFIVI